MRGLLATTAILLVFTGLFADTIVLKNGRRLVADTVVEEETRVLYETPLGKFSLAKSLVDHIEHDGAVSPPRPAQQQTTPQQTPPPEGSPEKSPAHRSAPVPTIGVTTRIGRVIVDEVVDRRFLEDLLRQPNPGPAAREFLVAAYLTAIEYEIAHGRLDSALEIARAGVAAPAAFTIPGDARLMMELSIVYLQRQEYRQARETLLHARTAAPNSAEVWKLLGFVEYSTDRVPDAVESWTKSLSLAPDPEVRQLLERARRESAAEDRFMEANSNHFTLRFEGGQVTQLFSVEILDTLERHFRDLERDLESAPREPITVILYPGQAFYDVTQAPSWTGALFDGKIRVPVEGLSSVTPQLSSVLKHEMTHSFVRARSQGRCPAWLNEGLAQIEEGKSSARRRAGLLDGLQQHAVPLSSLTAGFAGLDATAAHAAYALSLAATEMIRDQGGIGDVGRLLDRMAAGASVDDAMRDVLGYSLKEADSMLIAYLKKQG
jgi:tetratricopeptide (TPR) repeat protein